MTDDLYQENILDHFKNPRFQGELKGADVSMSQVNASCGDDIKLYLKTKPVKDDKQIIDISWQGQGCAISQAASSLLAEKIKREQPTYQQILKLSENDMMQMLGLAEVSPSRKKCLLLCLGTLKKAISITQKE